MGRKGHRTDHVSHRTGTDFDEDAMFDFEGRIDADKHSKYWKKTMKELRQKHGDNTRKTHRY